MKMKMRASSRVRRTACLGTIVLIININDDDGVTFIIILILKAIPYLLDWIFEDEIVSNWVGYSFCL